MSNAFRYTACYVNGSLTATASATPGQGCAGTSVQLNTTVTGSSSNTYSWSSIPAGFTSTLQNPVVTPTVTTSYIVNVTGGSCSAADTVTVTIVPQPTVVATANPQQVCPFGSSQLNATPSGTTSYSYLWTSVPAGFTSTQQNPVVNPGVATTYSVTITSGTCTATNSTTVGMLAPPTVVATASPSEICPNALSQLNSTPGTTGNYTYAWSSIPAGFTSSLPNPVVSPSLTTMYIVNMSSSGCQAGDSVTVTVDAIPGTPTITLTGDSIKSSSANGNQWFLNGNLLAGATGQYLVLTIPGSYQVQVTGPTGCISPMSASFVYVGINETANEIAARIYPNPTTGRVTISGEIIKNSSFHIRIFNSYGKAVLSCENKCSIDLSGLSTGIFYLTILNDRSEYSSKKVILVH